MGCLLCSACLFSSLVTCLVGQGCSPPALLTPVVFPLGVFLSVAAVLCLLLPPAKGVVGFCCASWPCLYSWSCSTWVFIHSVSGDWLLLGGFPAGCSSWQAVRVCALLPLALVAFRLQGWTCVCGGGGGGGSFLWIFGVQELEPSPSGPFLTVVCPSIGRPGGTGVRSLGWQWCCGSAIVCPSSAPLHFSMLRSLYFLTAPLPSRVLLWRSSPWVQWSLLLSLLQGFLQPSLRDVVVLGVLASSHDPLPSPLFL